MKSMPLYWLPLICGMLFLFSCQTQRPYPTQFEVQESDQQLAENPPTAEELLHLPRTALLYFTGAKLPHVEQNQIAAYFEQTLESNARIISIERLPFASETEVDLYKTLGQAQTKGTDYLCLIRLSPSPSLPNQTGILGFQGRAKIQIYQAKIGLLLMQEEVEINTNQLQEAPRSLQAALQQAFPRQGFILETRGGHRLAKINFGAGHGMRLDHPVTFHKRNLTPQGSLLKEEIIPLPVAVGKIVFLEENSAWVWVEEKDRPKVKTGLRVLIQPDSALPF